MSHTPINTVSRHAAFARTAAAWLYLAGCATLTHAVSPGDAAHEQHSWKPNNIFLQLGTAASATAMSIGSTWSWRWRRQYRLGTVTGYWEASIGRWESRRGQGANAWFTQLGVTPVFRLHPSSWGDGWFIEGGIGANFVAPLYRGENKQFSTVFNFGDHIALGRRFGKSRDQEVSLHLQHFSNAGIRRPNPGEDFLQLRYSKDL